MNFSPQNEQGLIGLVQALRGGMDPNTAYSIFQNIQQQQAQQIANRQARLSGLADLLTNAAVGGMPYSGAQALAEAQPGPAGPAVQNMLSSLYPTADKAPPTNASGATMDFPSGSRPTASGFTPEGYAVPQDTLGMGAQAMSPAYAPPQPSPTEALAMQEAQTAQATQQAFQEFVADASAAKAAGEDMASFLGRAAQFYPELFAGNVEQVQQIALTIFNAPTVGG